MLVDLHNHSFLSHDGFSKEREIINACKIKNINAIAITEHDEVCKLNFENFKKNGIELIPGIEYTTNNGAHIIGLFVTDAFKSGMSREDIVTEIKRQDGLVLMPHPWKPNSGYMDLYAEDCFIEEFDFIELLNGGWNSSRYISEIYRISKKYSLRMISSSDSHRGCQVGLCVTSINQPSSFRIGDSKEILQSVQQKNIDLLIDRQMLVKKGRKTRKFQIGKVYQFIIPLVPRYLKRRLKFIQYRFSKDGQSSPSDFSRFIESNND